jgi:hypothetical protein
LILTTSQQRLSKPKLPTLLSFGRYSIAASREEMFVDHAVPLIEIHGADDLVVNKEALNLIKSINEKVCIVAVAGLYRTGKSSLLNWLLGRNAGFTVGPSINRCTRGLWIWGTPIPGKLVSGEKCSIIILDTEGIGGVEGDTKYDARIFSLAVLLCSSLVYNSLGSIDETAISNLSFIAQLSHHIRISSTAEGKDDSAEEEDVSNFCKIFPSFVWVVRDFALQLVDSDGDPITPTQYLNSALEQSSGYDKGTMERNRIRSMLSAFFPDRSCVTLVRPISDESALQQVDLIPYDELREDFRESMDVLRHTVFDNLHPKSIDNKPLTGAMFAGLVVAYVSAINEGGVPTISSAWEGVSQQECLDAKEDSKSLYQSSIATLCPSDKAPFEEEDLRTSHSQCWNESIAAYRQRAVGSSAKEVLEKLQEEILEIHRKNLESNRSRSTDHCDHLFVELYDSIIRTKLNDSSSAEDVEDSNAPVSGGAYSSNLPLFREDWTRLLNEYQQRSKGPSRWEVYSTHAQHRLIDCLQIILNSLQVSYESHVNELRDTLQQKSVSLLSSEAENDVMKDKIQKIESILKDLERENTDLTAQCSTNTVMIEELTKQKRLMERYYEEEKDIRVRYEAKNTALSDRVKELEGVETQCFELRGEKDALAQRIVELQEEIDHMLAEKKKRCTIS